jgi:hypothetical protein
LEIEVTNISVHGLWILANDQEFFLSYEDFPWFKEKIIKDITNVQIFENGHMYWPSLDVDLNLEMIENPQRFPLKAKENV